VTEEYDLKTYADLGRVYANWVRGKQGEPEAGALGLKEALTSYLALGNKSGAPAAPCRDGDRRLLRDLSWLCA
jgi:hypothetical protein